MYMNFPIGVTSLPLRCDGRLRTRPAPQQRVRGWVNPFHHRICVDQWELISGKSGCIVSPGKRRPSSLRKACMSFGTCPLGLRMCLFGILCKWYINLPHPPCRVCSLPRVHRFRCNGRLAGNGTSSSQERLWDSLSEDGWTFKSQTIQTCQKLINERYNQWIMVVWTNYVAV